MEFCLKGASSENRIWGNLGRERLNANVGSSLGMKHLAGDFCVRGGVVIDMKGVVRSVEIEVIVMIVGSFFLREKPKVRLLRK